jgi:hypothetical protein
LPEGLPPSSIRKALNQGPAYISGEQLEALCAKCSGLSTGPAPMRAVDDPAKKE